MCLYYWNCGEFHVLTAIGIHLSLCSSSTSIMWVIAVYNVQTGLEALKRPYTVCIYTWCTFVTRGCHGHTESVGVSVSVLCNLKMTVQLLYVASVGLKSPRYICILCTCRYFPLPWGVIVQYCESECAVMVVMCHTYIFVWSVPYTLHYCMVCRGYNWGFAKPRRGDG